MSALRSDGTPDPIRMARTRQQPPIAVIGLRAGADPTAGGLWLNHIPRGTIAITLAHGTQSFSLFTRRLDAAPPYLLSLFLEHESTPAFSVLVGGDSDSLRLATHATVMGLDGEPVANHAALSVERRGFRVTLQRAAFPLSTDTIDTLGPWELRPDNVADHTGHFTLSVEPL